jgi:alanine-synthesizing transaminase
VRFALIENEARIRQAVRGIRAMFKADSLQMLDTPSQEHA